MNLFSVGQIPTAMPPTAPKSLLLPIPFYPQKWQLDHWQADGFTSRDEAEYWEGSSCGVLALRMAHHYLTHSGLPTSELIRRGVKLHAYTHRSGWSHQGLVDLALALGLEAERAHLSPQKIVDVLRAGRVPIISVKWAFRPIKTLKEKVLFWKKYGGHLAVVVGFESAGGVVTGFYVHHTSTTLEYNWQARLIPLKQFMIGYTGRGLVMSKPSDRSRARSFLIQI